MSVAAILVCTTLITNEANGTFATRVCHEEQPAPIYTAEPDNTSVITMQPAPPVAAPEPEKAPEVVKAYTNLPQSESLEVQGLDANGDVEKPVASPLAPVVKAAKPKRARIVKQASRRKIAKKPRRVLASKNSNPITHPAIRHQPAKKPTVWDRLVGALN